MEEFIRRLIGMFNITSYNEEKINNKSYTEFKIIHSTNDNEIPFITPDLATCPNCEKELKDENNRRYNHPFNSCINCGARYTIINTLPYDRVNITMSVFPLCDECQKEYTTPQDIRCHAQTIACNNCGPATNITINEAVQTLKNGEILAIKDIGGYHLSCLCETECALNLREIKGRETKPFAVMFKDIDEIIKQEIKNVLLLTALKTMPNVIATLCEADNKIDGFIAPGHVAVITGSNAFVPLAEKYSLPFAVSGFEAEEILASIYALIKLRRQGKVINLYKSAVTSERNEKAFEIVHKYFEEYDAPWRGLGIIKSSGMALKNKFVKYDAGSRELTNDYSHQKGCLCGEIISGNKKPTDCPLYNKICTPESPKGACMVSIEGTCYNYITNNRK